MEVYTVWGLTVYNVSNWNHTSSMLYICLFVSTVRHTWTNAMVILITAWVIVNNCYMYVLFRCYLCRRISGQMMSIQVVVSTRRVNTGSCPTGVNLLLWFALYHMRHSSLTRLVQTFQLLIPKCGNRYRILFFITWTIATCQYDVV